MALGEERVKDVEVDGDTVCAGQRVCGWRVGGAIGGNKGRWAGAERCPTEGGTDEVREMEGEKKRNVSWRALTFRRGRFLFIKSEAQQHLHLNYRNTLKGENPRHATLA